MTETAPIHLGQGMASGGPTVLEAQRVKESRSLPVERNGSSPESPVNWWPCAEILIRRWRWIAISSSALALIGTVAGWLLWKGHYTAVAQLIRYESPNADEVFRPRQVSSQTVANLLRSPELLERVATLAQPPISAGQLAANVRIIPERSSDNISVVMAAGDARKAVDLANLYANEAVRFTQNLQSQVAAEVDAYLGVQLTQIEKERAALNKQLQTAPPVTIGTSLMSKPTPGLRPASLLERLASARDELMDLQSRYTDAHPLVQAQRAKLSAMEAQFPARGGSTNGATGDAAKHGGAETAPSDYEVFRSQFQSLENNRLQLTARQRATQMFVKNPPGQLRLFSPASLGEVVPHGRALKVAFLTVFCALLGFAGSVGAILLHEFMDERIKTPADVKRVTRLPVLATLENLQSMDAKARRDWAFRTLTALQGYLSPSPNRGIVCGMTSATAGEGRSTWIELLAQAAGERGFRVLTIATQPTSASQPGANDSASTESKIGDVNGGNASSQLTTVLTTPAQVTEKLVGQDPSPRVHVPIPGWVWNLERRKQWQAALHQWQQIGNVVILVELPPASEPEAVLLAQNLPNLIWLTDSERANAGKTCQQLATLRHAHCQLVGAVLNRETRAPFKGRFARWFVPPDDSLTLPQGATNSSPCGV